MKKMTEKRQKHVASRMLALRGFRYFKEMNEVSKFEIAHSGLDITKVIAGHTFIRVKIREKKESNGS